MGVLAALDLWHHLPSCSPVLGKAFSLLSEPWRTEAHPCVKQKTLPQPPTGASVARLLPGVSPPLDPYEFLSPAFTLKSIFSVYVRLN